MEREKKRKVHMVTTGEAGQVGKEARKMGKSKYEMM